MVIEVTRNIVTNGKEPEQRRPGVLEHGTAAEELLEQRFEQTGDADDECDRPRVAPELREHACGDGKRDAKAHDTVSIKRRNTSSSRSAPVRARSSAGVA